jgi:hypothetical protein
VLKKRRHAKTTPEKRGTSPAPRLTCRVARAALCCCLLCAQTALAQGGPPLRTDDTATPGKGHWEINIAATFERERDERESELPLIDINYGVGERVQLKFEMPWLMVRERGARARRGPGKAAVGVKWRFFENERHGFAVSTYPQLEFNVFRASARRGLVEDTKELLLPFELTKKLGPVEVNGGIGYRLIRPRRDEWLYGLAVGRRVTKRLELLGEIYGTSRRGLEEDESSFNLGGRLRVRRHVTLLFSAGRSFRKASSGEPTLYVYAGTQFTF